VLKLTLPDPGAVEAEPFAVLEQLQRLPRPVYGSSSAKLPGVRKANELIVGMLMRCSSLCGGRSGGARYS
jgi:hypothetical protein